MNSATGSLSRSGGDAILIPAIETTHSRKNITGASHFPMNTLPQRCRGGKRIGATSSSFMAPPASIIKHSSIGTNPAEELWNYRHMPGAGGDVSLQFIDRCACGEYALVGNLPHSN